jgi:hypothetical protein
VSHKYSPYLIKFPSSGRGGRIYRAGMTTQAGRIHVGSIESILSNEPPKQLSILKINEIQLDDTQLDDGFLTCNLFLEEEKKTASVCNVCNLLVTVSQYIPGCKGCGFL